MSDRNQDMEALLKGADLDISPDSQRMQSVQACLLGTAPAARPCGHARRVVGLGAVLLVGAATAGLAGTQAGRNWVRQIVTPVYKSEVVVVPSVPNPDAPGTSSMIAVGRMSTGGDAKPFTPEEIATINAEMAEVQQIQKAGGGRLAGLLEGVGPDGVSPQTVLSVEYTLASGKKSSVGESKRTFADPHVDEVLQLRDSGAGEIISSEPSPIGLGHYTIRFTLADGTTMDLTTNYPPGARAEREKIMAETRALKAARRFKVQHANTGHGNDVFGLLRYTLADGRQVGITETIPPDVVTPDGKNVITTETGETAQPGR